MTIDDFIHRAEELRSLAEWRGLDGTPTDERDAYLREECLDLLGYLPGIVASIRKEIDDRDGKIYDLENKNQDLVDENEYLADALKKERLEKQPTLEETLKETPQ